MADSPSALKDWLTLARLSNLPTVWSNVVLGVVVGYIAAFGEPIVWTGGVAWTVAGLLLGVSLVYAAGMVLNDVCDAAVDADERPERPIPSGRVPAHTAGVVGLAALLAGWVVVAASVHPMAIGAATALLLCVLGYDVMHHRVQGAWVLMGLCRGLVVLTAELAFGPVLDAQAWRVWVAAGVLTAYTLALTWVSRQEHGDRAAAMRRWVLRLIVAMPAVDAALILALGVPGTMGYAVVSLLCIPACEGMQRVVRGV